MNKKKFEALLQEIKEGKLSSGTLSSPRNSGESLKKVQLRSVKVKGETLYQISKNDGQKITHCNLSFDQCSEEIKNYLNHIFKQGVFKTHSNFYHILIDKKREATVLVKEINSKEPNQEHNRQKKHLLQENSPLPFLVALGIMTTEGKVIAKKYDKFRQINHFLEIIKEIIKDLREGPLEIIDFGCGKAYLTFALYHYLNHMIGRHVHVVGLDLKQEVVDECQRLADKLGYTSLQFLVGDINSHQPKAKIDLMISLHACDTATDAALEKGVVWGADVMLCVPCCQHELYSQLENSSLASLLRHGILRERLAALATDAARAELLTIFGYDVQVMEFIDMAHTPKNLLIRAVKASSKDKRDHARKRYLALKQLLNITPSLEKRLLIKQLDD